MVCHGMTFFILNGASSTTEAALDNCEFIPNGLLSQEAVSESDSSCPDSAKIKPTADTAGPKHSATIDGTLAPPHDN